MNNFKSYTALDISSYFIGRSVSPLKLQKLLYYSQLWFFVKNRKYLFTDQISAWIFGPVVYNVWSNYKFIKRTDIIPLNRAYQVNLDEIINHLNEVWDAYGHLDGAQLVELTHNEKPWLNSRIGLLNEQPSGNDVIINHDTVSDFKLDKDLTIPKAFMSSNSLGHFGNF